MARVGKSDGKVRGDVQGRGESRISGCLQVETVAKAQVGGPKKVRTSSLDVLANLVVVGSGEDTEVGESVEGDGVGGGGVAGGDGVAGDGTVGDGVGGLGSEEEAVTSDNLRGSKKEKVSDAACERRRDDAKAGKLDVRRRR